MLLGDQVNAQALEILEGVAGQPVAIAAGIGRNDDAGAILIGDRVFGDLVAAAHQVDRCARSLRPIPR